MLTASAQESFAGSKLVFSVGIAYNAGTARYLDLVSPGARRSISPSLHSPHGTPCVLVDYSGLLIRLERLPLETQHLPDSSPIPRHECGGRGGCVALVKAVSHPSYIPWPVIYICHTSPRCHCIASRLQQRRGLFCFEPLYHRDLNLVHWGLRNDIELATPGEIRLGPALVFSALPKGWPRASLRGKYPVCRPRIRLSNTLLAGPTALLRLSALLRKGPVISPTLLSVWRPG